MRELRKIQNAGITAFVLGVFFLIAPIFVKNSKLLKPLADNLASSLSWVFILLGIGLIGLHAILNPNDETEKNASSASNTEPESLLSKPSTSKTIARFNTKPESSFLTSLTEKLNIKLERQWSKQVFADIEWRRFEAVCEALFAQAGFETRAQSHGADGGVDIWLHSAHAQGPVSVVQCKHWQGKPIGVKEIREFYGVMASHKLQRGTYATTSAFTADALQFAKDNGINAMNGTKLLELIATRTPEQQLALLTVAYEGDYATPTCASCGIKLLERTASKTGKSFWGCSNFPRCKSTLPKVAT